MIIKKNRNFVPYRQKMTKSMLWSFVVVRIGKLPYKILLWVMSCVWKPAIKFPVMASCWQPMVPSRKFERLPPEERAN